MNKLGIVLGVAAVAVVSGCKDPNYNRAGAPAQNEAKDAAPIEEPAQQAPAEAQPVQEQAKCTCPPGTKHEKPCACGAADCVCVVTTKAVEQKPAEPEFTVYVVQNGDYLAKISKKFNITIKSIKELNNLKSDTIRVGQKLKLPGKVDVGEQKAPVVRKADATKPTSAYAGATKEYVVKGGDTLGAIAYGSGISIRQLKEMNGLVKDTIRVGQKLKVPAEKVQKAKAAEKKAEKKPAVAAKPAEKKVEEKPAPAKAEPAKKVEEKPAESAPVEPAVEPAADENAAPIDAVAPEAASTIDYTVKDGEDIMSIVVKYGLDPSVIRELNHLEDGDELKAGQVIKLPADVQL